MCLSINKTLWGDRDNITEYFIILFISEVLYKSKKSLFLILTKTFTELCTLGGGNDGQKLFVSVEAISLIVLKQIDLV